MYTRKTIEAIKIVIDLNKRRMSMIDHFYRGDKDTYAAAFDSVMREKSIDLEFWGDYDKDEISKYKELYKEEINTKFLYLVEWGKDEIEFLKTIDDYLLDLIDHVDMNLNYNKFEFPIGTIEIDSSKFDPSNN